jgi:hypothetical protein
VVGLLVLDRPQQVAAPLVVIDVIAQLVSISSRQ